MDEIRSSIETASFYCVLYVQRELSSKMRRKLNSDLVQEILHRHCLLVVIETFSILHTSIYSEIMIKLFIEIEN